MINTALRITPLLFLLLNASCGRQEELRKKISVTDSLAGSVGALSAQLRGIDTSAMLNMLRQHDIAIEFISSRSADTIGRDHAEQLQRLSVAGTQLRSFTSNRHKLLHRATLLQNQLKTLSDDAVSGRIDPERMEGYVQIEKRNTAEFCSIAQNELRLYHSAVKQFNLVFPAVAGLVKSMNEGNWPTVFADSSAAL